MSYLGKFSPYIAEVCDSLRKFTSMKSEQTWNNTYPNPYERTKIQHQKDSSMTFYNEKKSYLETEIFDVGLRARLLQVRNGMWFPKNETPGSVVIWSISFASKSLTSAKVHYSNIKRDTLGIYNKLEVSLLLCPQR